MNDERNGSSLFSILQCSETTTDLGIVPSIHQISIPNGIPNLNKISNIRLLAISQGVIYLYALVV